MHAHSKTVFDLLDEDGSGTITVEEFQRLGFLFNLHNREIRLIFKDFDISGDDALDYSEFRMFTLACINKQKSMKKKRFKTLLQRRFNFLAKQRQPILQYINKTINECVP
jgi:Ca2+-binding EF-hand superfamily protein